MCRLIHFRSFCFENVLSCVTFSINYVCRYTTPHQRSTARYVVINKLLYSKKIMGENITFIKCVSYIMFKDTFYGTRQDIITISFEYLTRFHKLRKFVFLLQYRIKMSVFFLDTIKYNMQQ